MYWEKEIETLERRDLEKLQVERLVKSLGQAVHSPYYRKEPEIQQIIKSGLSSVEHIRELPFTTKEQLRNDFPWGISICK